MRETSLCYIEHNGKLLLLHRTKKKDDPNEGKWIGVGGKFEDGESPEECMKREVLEETGLTVERYQYRGIVTFVSDTAETEYMHLFTVDKFSGEVSQCTEGELSWIASEQAAELPQWDGDKIFLSLITKSYPFFSLKLVYSGDRLLSALLDGRPVLVSDRLILRYWFEEDAEALYHYAGDPEVGSAAGWLVQKSVDESREMIRSILSSKETYAIVPKNTPDPIGMIGFSFESRRGLDLGSDGTCAELSYWLGRSFWGRGYTSEAAEVILRHGFCDLNLRMIWCGYYEGNERSRKLQEKYGFRYNHTVKDIELPLFCETRTEHFMYLTREAYLQSIK